MKNADFPLYKHGNGQWCKSIRGKKHYFGTDQEEALAKYVEERDYLFAGKPRPEKRDVPTLQELANVFLASVKKRVAAGELGDRSYQDYKSTLERLILFRGWNDYPGDWAPLDFGEIKEWLFEPVERKTPIRGGIKGPKVSRRNAVTVSNDQARIRAWLNWCYSAELIPQPRYGHEFSKMTAKQRRVAKNKAGRRDMSAEDIQLILSNATPYFKPLVLLGINGAVGATDLSLFTRNQFDGSEWIDCPRNKTGVARRVWLWPETLAAIDNYQVIRREPYREMHSELMFLTGHRVPWVRDGYDAAAKAFRKVANQLSISASFYDLRRTFATIAEESMDFPAVKFIMGHAPASSDMSSVYRQAISDERIQKVCQQVRIWLFPQPPKNTV